MNELGLEKMFRAEWFLVVVVFLLSFLAGKSGARF